MKRQLLRKWKLLPALLVCMCLIAAGLLFPGGGQALTAQASDWTSWLWGGEDDDETVWSSDDASSKKDSGKTSKDSGKSGTKDQSASSPDSADTEDITQIEVDEDGTYTSKLEVAAYIYQFGHLPDNFIKKNKAKKLGWVSSEGNLDEVAPGKSIGGDYFGNYEGLLPEKDGRDYYECDIDYQGGFRDKKRIIYSSDGLIYYTEDHYKTFEELYGGE